MNGPRPGPSNAVATVAICSRDRPTELRRLLESISRSRFRRIERPELDVLVVVNGPDVAGYDESAMNESCGWPVRMIHEPRPGVTIARNTAIANRSPRAAWLLCVDDDETVTPSWLENHLEYALTAAADVVTGPVLTVVPEGARPWVRELWLNVPRHRTGEAQKSFLGGNVLFRSSLFDELDEWYDETQALSTGDDAHLGARLTEAGYTIVWNDSAIAWEAVHPERLRPSWLIRRFLSYGGGRALALRQAGGIRRVIPALPGTLAGFGAVAKDLARGRDPRYLGQAIAKTCEIVGFVGGIFGLRVRDYRQVTSVDHR